MEGREIQRGLFNMGDDRESFKDFLQGMFTVAEKCFPGVTRMAFEEWSIQREEEEMETDVFMEEEADDF